MTTPFQPAEIQLDRTSGSITIRINGALRIETISAAWAELNQIYSDESLPSKVIIEAANISYCDTSGIAMLLDFEQHLKQTNRTLVITNLAKRYHELIELFPENITKTLPPPPHHQKCCMPEEVGRGTIQILSELRTFITFTGELTANYAKIIRHPCSIRFGEVMRIVEAAGVNGFPIVALIGFLLGLILAFQSAMPMNMFGAGIFVANLVSLSLVRELGPLITAIIFAGRSGSSFAAELGTMKVNDEINALVTMGLDPVSFLAIPRTLASIIVVPLLAGFAMLFGIIGAAPVILSLGYPLVTYTDRVASTITTGDLLGGLFKAMIFGLLISAVGCHQGLQTRSGAQAVGESTTRAVVQSIVFIALADGLFAVVFYYLGI